MTQTMQTVAAAPIEPTDADATPDRGSRRLASGIWLNDVAARLRNSGGPSGRIGQVVAMVCEAISLGVMRRDEINEMVQRTYASRPNFYDPRRYQLPHEATMLPELTSLRGSCRLLDAFCGQGREAKLFADAGYVVTAIDQLGWMIDRAKDYAVETGFEARFLTADFGSFDPPQPFDVVYTSCWMYSTIQGADRRREFLEHCNRLCTDDGIVVLSYVSRNDGSALGAIARFAIAKSAALFTLGNLATEFGERIYTGLFWHHLSDADVRRETNAAGWRIVRVVEGVGMDPTFLFLQRKERETHR